MSLVRRAQRRSLHRPSVLAVFRHWKTGLNLTLHASIRNERKSFGERCARAWWLRVCISSFFLSRRMVLFVGHSIGQWATCIRTILSFVSHISLFCSTATARTNNSSDSFASPSIFMAHDFYFFWFCFVLLQQMRFAVVTNVLTCR